MVADVDKYRGKWDRPIMEQAQLSLDMMKDFHGKSLSKTHGGIDGFILEQKLGINKWDKDHEYPIWMKDALLRCETAYNPDDVFTEEEWKAVEMYAVEDTGIKEHLVTEGNKFRNDYFACGQARGCVKNNDANSLDVDNLCRRECMDEAAEKSDFISVNELKMLREKEGTVV